MLTPTKIRSRAEPLNGGRYYDCTIQEVTANGYKVVFPEYGNVEEVPLEYLQKKVAVSSAKVRQRSGVEYRAEGEGSDTAPLQIAEPSFFLVRARCEQSRIAVLVLERLRTWGLCTPPHQVQAWRLCFYRRRSRFATPPPGARAARASCAGGTKTPVFVESRPLCRGIANGDLFSRPSLQPQEDTRIQILDPPGRTSEIRPVASQCRN